MHAKHKLLVPWLMLCSTTCSTQPASNEGSTPMSASTSAKDPVTLSAGLPEPLVLGEAWPLTVALRNSSEERITVSLRKDDRTDVTVKIWDARGEQLKPTDFGARHLPYELLRGVPVDWGGSGSATLKHLQPGESHSWKIALHKWFDFSPGEYTLELSVPVRPLGHIRHKTEIVVMPMHKSPGS